MSQAGANKRERERNRQAKAVAKAERRTLRRESNDATGDAGPAVDQQAVLAQLAALHEQFDAEQIELDDILDRKAELMQLLVVPDA